MRIQCSLRQENIGILKICAVNKMISECVKQKCKEKLKNITLVRGNFNIKNKYICHLACGILVPLAGIEPRSPSLEVQNPNYWTAKEVKRKITSNTKNRLSK